MGGAQKLLLPFGDGPVIRRPVRAAAAAGLADIIVVVGPDDDEVARAIHGLPATVVTNPDHASGQGSSVAVALHRATERADGVAILLGDEPEIDPEVIRAAVAAWREFPTAALRVRYSDRPGHPVIVPAAVASTIRPGGDLGLRDALKRLVELAVDRPAPADIDTEDAYRAALARLRQ